MSELDTNDPYRESPKDSRLERKLRSDAEAAWDAELRERRRAERAETRVKELEAALHDIRSVAPDRDDATYLYAFEKVLDIARSALGKGEL